ncbi:MAG: hypothetical protein HY941_12280 [Gammaproteobacteria bacterium]|nr:hypothetical protein [Gammaproteobacteria bacterium]
MSIRVEIPVGDFLDKLSILEIKAERIQDPAKLANIRRELDMLRETWDASPYADQDIATEYAELKTVNESLWDIEDHIRDQERTHAFGERFIELARAVYLTNDRRAEIKRILNLKLGSALVEEKSYQEYR